MRKRPTPETDAVAAYEGNWDTKALRMTAHSRKLERERDELRQWKKEMLLIESQWDEQIVGRLLGLQLGDYIKPNIEPKLRQLIRERDEARSELSLKQQTLTIAEGTLSDLRKQRDEWSAMCGRYKQERDEALMALKCIDEAILVMKPRHIGQPDMDGRYPCWSVWLPKSGRVERKSLQDALLEFAAQIKEETK